METNDQERPAWVEDAVLLKTYMDIPIYVNQEGAFMAELPGTRVLNRQKMSDVEAEIRKLAIPISVMLIDAEPPRTSHNVYSGLHQTSYLAVDVALNKKTDWQGFEVSERFIQRIRTPDGEWVEGTYLRTPGRFYLYDGAIAQRLKELDTSAMNEIKALHAQVESAEDEVMKRCRGWMQKIVEQAVPLERKHLKRKDANAH